MPPPQGCGSRSKRRERCSHELCRNHRQTPRLGAVPYPDLPGRWGDYASLPPPVIRQRLQLEGTPKMGAKGGGRGRTGPGSGGAGWHGTVGARRCHRCLHKVPAPCHAPERRREGGDGSVPPAIPHVVGAPALSRDGILKTANPSSFLPAWSLGEAPMSLKPVYTLKT